MDVCFYIIYADPRTSLSPSASHKYCAPCGVNRDTHQSGGTHRPGKFRDQIQQVRSYRSKIRRHHPRPVLYTVFPTIPELWDWYNPEIDNDPAIRSLP